MSAVDTQPLLHERCVRLDRSDDDTFDDDVRVLTFDSSVWTFWFKRKYVGITEILRVLGLLKKKQRNCVGFIIRLILCYTP